MAMTIDELSTLLEEVGIKQYKKSDATKLSFGIATDNYRGPEGQPGLSLVVELSENGEYFKVWAFRAFVASGPHLDAFLKACMALQWKTKLVQFEFDESDGEIRPIVEFPLEDSKLTAKQLGRSVHGLVHIVDHYFPFLKRILDAGVVEWPKEKGDAPATPDDAEILALMKRLADLMKGRGAPATGAASPVGPPTSV